MSEGFAIIAEKMTESGIKHSTIMMEIIMMGIHNGFPPKYRYLTTGQKADSPPEFNMTSLGPNKSTGQ
jgi:hypothetical protein